MAVTRKPGLGLDEAFAQRFPQSLAQFRRATTMLPAGITHDTRHFAPYPIYVERADGARK